MAGAQALLIYDGFCPYCKIWRKAVDLIDVKDGLAYLPFYASPAQKLLDAQFGRRHRGFTIYLAEKGRIYWAHDAASRVAEHLRVPFGRDFLARVVYPAAAWAVTKTVGVWHRPHMPAVRKPFKDADGRTYAKLSGKAGRMLKNILRDTETLS